MNRDDLKQTLRQPYRRDTWSGLLRTVFGEHVRINAEAQRLPAEDDAIQSIAQIGDVLLSDGKTLAIIEVEVGDDVNLLRNRVGLRNRVAKFIDQDRAHGVLAVFSSSRPEYRFSFTAREILFDEELGMVEKETATKRFTYVLGPGESCTTAAQRFERLSEKHENLLLDDVVEAFSVEKLNKEFFRRYKEQYLFLVKYLLVDAHAEDTRRRFLIPSMEDLELQEKADKPVRDFVKTLLGRIVFLHFLQKKGWLGCPAGSRKWVNGDPSFLSNFLNLASERGHADLFHSRYLTPLFFEALNRPDREGDLFHLTQTRLPYLNGGLFEEDSPELREIDFPEGAFRELLAFFGEYNFTIDENDPEDHEVGIDPEMLSHIFENLLEDNKDKGAFYTPKAIVAFMARESLLRYLQTHLGEDSELELLLNAKNLENHPPASFVEQNKNRIITLLDDVKICDPAIGSSAFPIGLLQEIFWTRLTLQPELNTPAHRANLKRNIIQNSIHGVDIDPGAIEIARLRFWLTLVVDEEQPRPLPNLDYKIHCADSLIERLRGETVDLHKFSSFSPATKGFVDQLVSAKLSLFNAQRLPEKRKAWLDFYYALARLTREFFFRLRLDANELFNTNSENFFELNETLQELEHWVKRIHQVRQKTVETQDRLIREAKSWFEDPNHPSFLWNLHFGEVFAKGGFDILIANPPYISVEKFSGSPLQQEWKRKFSTYASRGDVYAFFYEQALNLLKPSGTLTFITSNKFQRAGYGKNLRNLLSKQKIHTIIDFCELPVFAAATDPLIIVLNKQDREPAQTFSALVVKTTQEMHRLQLSLSNKAVSLRHDQLGAQNWSLDGLDGHQLVSKLRMIGLPLEKIIKSNIYRSILTGLNDAYVITKSKRQELIRLDPKCEEILKPWVRGKDIQKWTFDFNDLYLITLPSSENYRHPWSECIEKEALEVFKETFPSVAAHLLSYKNELVKRTDQGRFFWELRSCDYWPLFEKEKIVFNETSKCLHAYLDISGNIINKTGFIIVGENLGFLLSVMNSRLLDWFYRSTFPSWGDPWGEGRIQFRGNLMKMIPIPPASAADKKRLTDLAQSCGIAAMNQDHKTLSTLESEIDQIVYSLFSLTPEEIFLVESAMRKEGV